VPSKLLLNILPVVPKATTAHGDLATKLLEKEFDPDQDNKEQWNSWIGILPDPGFEKGLPMFWNDKWWKYLNEGCSGMH